MPSADFDADSFKQSMVASILAVTSLAEIVLVLFLTMKEIFKKTGDSYVLKD